MSVWVLLFLQPIRNAYCRCPGVCSKALFRECAIVFLTSAIKTSQNVEMEKHLVGLCVLIMLSFGPVLKYSIHLLCPLVFFNPKPYLFSVCIMLVEEDTAELCTETRPYQFTSFSVLPFTFILFTNDDGMPYKLSCLSVSIGVYLAQSSI